MFSSNIRFVHVWLFKSPKWLHKTFKDVYILSGSPCSPLLVSWTHVHVAFLYVEHLMRDVHFGWLIRLSHAHGASHIARGSYTSELLVLSCLAWSWFCLAMSFWGATVITSMFSAFPFLGDPFVPWWITLCMLKRGLLLASYARSCLGRVYFSIRLSSVVEDVGMPM